MKKGLTIVSPYIIDLTEGLLDDDLLCSFHHVIAPLVADTGLFGDVQIADMACAVSERLCQMETDLKFPDKLVSFPEIVIRLRNEPARHIYRVLIGDQSGKNCFLIFVV